MKILTVIVSYNALRWDLRCIECLRSSEVATDVLVVDNASSDGSPEAIRKRFPEVRLIESRENLGFGAANNIGLRIAVEEDYDFVYLLNQDAWIEPDTLRLLLNRAGGGFDLLSPVQRSRNGELDTNFRRKCSRALRGRKEGCAEVNFVMAAHWLLSRKAILSVGGFSPAFRQYGEDDNYIDRLHFHGLRAAVVCEASAIHDRAERRCTKEQKMRLKCISVPVQISDPGNCLAASIALQPLRLLAMAVKNASCVPLRYLWEMKKALPGLVKLRKESEKKGAFL